MVLLQSVGLVGGGGSGGSKGWGGVRESAFLTRPSQGREAGSWIVLWEAPISLSFPVCKRSGQSLHSQGCRNEMIYPQTNISFILP